MRLLITGATDGLGLEAARRLHAQGHDILLHGRSAARLAAAEKTLSASPNGGQIETHLADLSRLADVAALADAVQNKHRRLDVLINNAGVYAVENPLTPDKMDIRFVVNTIAPYLLTKRLLPLLGAGGRVVNLSSTSQAPVTPSALASAEKLDDKTAYAQSKRALTMWSCQLGRDLKAASATAPVIVAVHPGALLATKMVKEAYGVDGHNPAKGADIIVRAATAETFAAAHGKYYDNDARKFTTPPDTTDAPKCQQIIKAIEAILQHHT